MNKIALAVFVAAMNVMAFAFTAKRPQHCAADTQCWIKIPDYR